MEITKARNSISAHSECCRGHHMAGRSRSEAGDLLRISMLTPNGSIKSASDSEEGGPTPVPGAKLAAKAPALQHRRKPSMAGIVPLLEAAQSRHLTEFQHQWTGA